MSCWEPGAFHHLSALSSQTWGQVLRILLTYKEPEKWSDKQQSWDRKPGFLNIKHKQRHWAVLGPPIPDYDQGNFSLRDNSAVTSPCTVTFVSSSLPLLSYFLHESELWKLYRITFHHLKVIVTLPLNGEEINTVDSWTTWGLGVPTPMQWNFRV